MSRRISGLSLHSFLHNHGPLLSSLPLFWFDIFALLLFAIPHPLYLSSTSRTYFHASNIIQSNINELYMTSIPPRRPRLCILTLVGGDIHAMRLFRWTFIRSSRTLQLVFSLRLPENFNLDDHCIYIFTTWYFFMFNIFSLFWFFHATLVTLKTLQVPYA